MNTSGLSSKLRRAGGGEDMAPAVLLAQMGLHERHQGNGYGQQLFYLAAQHAASLYQVARLQLFTLDAADDDLAAWYEKLGMKRIPNSFRLVADLSKLPPDSAGSGP